MEKAAAAAGLPALRQRQMKARTEGHYLGLGVATFSERTGYGTPAFAARGMEVAPGWETVELAMDPSGFVEARIGAGRHGRGLRTTLAQIIGDELGVAPDRITITHGDTDRTPYGFGTFASRSLVIAGGAAVMAARKVSAKLRSMAGHLLEAAASDILLADGVARARAAYHQAHRFGSELTPGLRESATYDPPGTFSNACHIAVVAIDIETGKVMLEKLHDLPGLDVDCDHGNMARVRESPGRVVSGAFAHARRQLASEPMGLMVGGARQRRDR